MPIHPTRVWRRLSPTRQQTLVEELTAIVQEVIHEHIRTYHGAASGAPGDYLHPPIQPHQPIDPQDRLRLQYALHNRAQALGWAAAAIEVIDCDLGTTASSAEHRAGFKELLAQVTLGEVGLILSFAVTRLSRNCSDW